MKEKELKAVIFAVLDSVIQILIVGYLNGVIDTDVTRVHIKF